MQSCNASQLAFGPDKQSSSPHPPTAASEQQQGPDLLHVDPQQGQCHSHRGGVVLPIRMFVTHKKLLLLLAQN